MLHTIPDYPFTPTQSDVRSPSTQVPNNPPKPNIDKPKLDKPISGSVCAKPSVHDKTSNKSNTEPSVTLSRSQRTIKPVKKFVI